MKLKFLSLFCSVSLCFGASSDFGIDKFSSATLYSFGVGLEFLPTLQKNTLLSNSTDNTKLLKLVNRFDASYEFIPIIRSMIIQAGIPQEFLFLAMAESNFSLKAYSRKKAVGIWQFMPRTAKDMGLKIDSYVDERRDPIKSTQAAIKYLQFLYSQTGEWYLAAMAYNCGLGRLNKAIQRAGSSDLIVLLDEEEKYLPAETRGYIKTILSLSVAFKNVQTMQENDKEYLLNRGAADTLSKVNIKGGSMLADVAKSAKMSLNELKEYNRHLLHNFLPPHVSEYPIYIPYEKLAFFKQNFKADSTRVARVVIHKVKKGESIASIAKKYNISAKEVKLSNNNSDKLLPNRNLIIPIVQNSIKR